MWKCYTGHTYGSIFQYNLFVQQKSIFILFVFAAPAHYNLNTNYSNWKGFLSKLFMLWVNVKNEYRPIYIIRFLNLVWVRLCEHSYFPDLIIHYVCPHVFCSLNTCYLIITIGEKKLWKDSKAFSSQDPHIWNQIFEETISSERKYQNYLKMIKNVLSLLNLIFTLNHMGSSLFFFLYVQI